MFFNRRVFIISFSSTPFTLSFLCIYIARAEYCFIPHDAVEWRKLGFWILLFKQQFKALLEQFYFYVI